MRIIAFADLQLQAYREFSKVDPRGYNSRALTLMERLTELIKAEHKKNSLDAVCILGDFWDNRFAIEVDLLDLAHVTLGEWAKLCPVYLLEGNHDQFQKSGLLTSLTQFSAYCTVVRKPSVHEIGGERVAFSPYHPGLEIIQEGLRKLKGENAKYLFGHWTVAGASTGSATLEKGIDRNSDLLKGYKYVLLGDIHKHQYLTENMLYLGSPAQHDFGERGEEKNIWLLDEGRLEPIPTNLPHFVVTNDLDEARQHRALGNYVEYVATSFKHSEEARGEGLRIKNDFRVTISEEDRPLINSSEEAVSHWVKIQDREDLLDMGLKYINNDEFVRETPNHKVNIKHLIASDFFSYERMEVDFSKEWGLVCVNGIVEGDAECDSNGAGKTAIYEALYFTLYGRTLRYGRENRKAIRKGQESTSGDVTIEADGTLYRITRSVPGSLKILIPQDSESEEDNVKDGWDSRLTMGTSAATQNLINQIVGDSEVFLRLTLLALHYYPSFLSLDDRKKKEFIDEAAGTWIFDKAFDAVSEDLKDLKIELDSTQNKFDTQEKLVTNEEAIIQETERDLEAHLEQERKKVLKRREEAAELREKADSVKLRDESEVKRENPEPLEESIQTLKELQSESETRIEELKKERGAKVSEIEEFKKQKAVAQEFVETVSGQLEEAKEIHNEAVSGLKEIESEEREKLAPVRATIKSFEEFDGWKPGDKCTTCGYVFSEKDDTAEAYLHMEAEAKKARETLKSIQESYVDVKKEAASIIEEAEESVETSKDDVKKAKARVLDIEDALEALEKGLGFIDADLEKESKEIEKCRSKIEEIQESLRNAEERYREALELLREDNRIREKQRVSLINEAKSLEDYEPDRGESYLKTIERSKKRIEKLRSEQSTLEGELKNKKNIVADYEFWRTGFGNRGCKGFLYTGFIDAINATIQQYSDIISGGTFLIQLLPYSEGKKNTQEKISLKVSNSSGSDSFEGDSLGERARIDIPVNLAIREAVSKSGLSFNFLFADEPWIGLDDSGKRAVYRVFEVIRKNVTPTILITDQSGFSKGFLDTSFWEVRKTVENGVPTSTLSTQKD